MMAQNIYEYTENEKGGFKMSIITSSGKMLHLHMGDTSVGKPEKIEY